MPVRKNLKHQDIVRSRIRTSQLMRRLKKHALGQIQMTATQIKAAEILLKKTLPDLAAVQIDGKVTYSYDSAIDQIFNGHQQANDRSTEETIQ